MPPAISSISIVIPSHRDGVLAVAAARSMAACTLPAGVTSRILIVAQDWQPGIAAPDGVEVIALAGAAGRSAARNIGARATDGDVLLFLDADCRPVDSEYLAILLSAFEDPEVVAAGGPLLGAGTSFWRRYQADADARRGSASIMSGTTLTSANLAIRREAFNRLGGFDEDYVGYGFEDRDLLLRLAASGTVLRRPGAAVIHEDRLDLGAVAGKMCEAGTRTSARFANAHPAEYRRLGYAAIDARAHPWLWPLGRLLGPACLHVARRLDPMLQWMPYPLARSVVRGISALAFLYGTTRQPSQ